MAARRGHARGQRVDVPQRPGRVDVTEGLQPGLGRGRGQPGRLAGQPGDRAQQRPVEQLLVQPPDLAGVLAPSSVNSCRVCAVRLPRWPLGPRGPQGPAQAAQHGLVFGQEVGAAQLVELEQVLDAGAGTGKPRPAVGVVPADVAALGQRGQRRQGGRAAQRLVGAAVYQLQQLDRELDVAQAAGAELDLPWRLVRRAGVATTRRRMACTSSTKFSRCAACQTSGVTASSVLLAQRACRPPRAGP